MTELRRQSLTAYAAPLCETVVECPQPRGTQVLVRVAPGAAVAVYPWIGCGDCAACRRGEENICAAPRHLGINADGGFATHVLVPHPRYLIDYAPLSASFAATLMCSGLTAYAALNRLAAQAALGPLL